MKQIIIPSPITALFFVFGVLFFNSPSPCQADSVSAQQWEITADSITRYENPASVIAEGNVILERKESVTRSVKGEQEDTWTSLLGETAEETADAKKKEKTVTVTKTLTTIQGDWMAYDMDLGKVKARGNLVIDIGPDQISADSGVVDLNQETGTFTDATILREYKEMHLEGKKIEKTGDLTYHIEDGWVVTCKLKEGETPPWSFAAADATITDGGYAFLKHATFRIKDVPVLYTPVMWLPAKRERQTGFLFPNISISNRDGYGFEIPFFINLSPSSDITLYSQYLTNRGFMAGAEFRYVVDQNDKGAIMGNYLSDSLSDPSETEYYEEGGYTHTNKDRYWVRGKADQDIGEWTTRLDLDIVSDRDYLTEFNTGLTGFQPSQNKFLEVFGRGFDNKTADSRDNSLQILRSWSNGIALQGEFLGINDVSLEKDPALEDEDPPQVDLSPLWKLPAFNFTGLLPVAETGIDFTWNTDYVNYWREEGVGAQRIDLYPRLTMAIPLSSYLETTVRGGVRDTYYMIQENGAAQWDGNDSENRLLADFGTEIGTTLMRDFAVGFGDVYAIDHTFRPYISYDFVTDHDQEDLPQFDYVDEVADQNIFYYGFDNFFSVFSEHNGKKSERDYGYLKIRQGYDISEEETDTPWEPVEVQLGYYPVNNFSFIYRTNIDVYDDGMYYHSVEADYRSRRGDYLSLDYRYNSISEINSISADAWVLLPYNFALGYSIERSIEDSLIVEEEITLLYQAPCWSVELASNSTPGDHTFMLMFRLANIGNPLGLDLPGF